MTCIKMVVFAYFEMEIKKKRAAIKYVSNGTESGLNGIGFGVGRINKTRACIKNNSLICDYH